MDGVRHMHPQPNTTSSQPRNATRFALISFIILTSASAMTLSGCIAAAAAAGAGAGYAIGHEQGEDHVTSGEHGDDD